MRFISIPTDIEDASERPFLNSLSHNLQYSLGILEKVMEKSFKAPLEDVDTTILALYRRLLSQFDGVCILLDHGSLNAAVVATRAAFETYVSLMFIFMDGEEFLKHRAASYFIFYKLAELKEFKDQRVLTRMSKLYSAEEIQQMKNSVNKTLNKISPFKEAMKKRSELIKFLKNENRKESVQWYSLYPKTEQSIYTLKNLINYVDKSENNLNKLYALLSMEIHSLNVSNDLEFEGDKVLFNDLRHKENIENYDVFRQVRDFLANSTLHIISRYLYPHYATEFGEFYENDRAITKSIWD